ncbi:MAG TPA: serine hydrolase [Isosphaeraceae bacterium]|nr:serine hydrolase [Isosphaeraceae bacterium]
MTLDQDPEVQSGIRLLEAWIDSQMAYRGLPGMSIGIVYDQDLIWSRGFGHADVEQQVPAGPETIYRIASISKLFTSTAILQLRDRGKLRLDDPVAAHLPWFALKGRDPDAPAVTIEHLLTHTAGLPRESAFPYWTDFAFPTREQIIETLPRQEVVYAPDTKWKYSNLAIALAGELVAAASGEPYEGYVGTNILEPLGMSSTSVVLPAAHRSRLATGYGRRLPDGRRAVRPFTEARGIAAAAGLSSTVGDLARFAALQFHTGPGPMGERPILKGSTLREMHRVHWLQPDWKSGWGLGFSVIHREERDLVGHGGWVAGYQTAMYFSPAEKVAVIALTNADDGHPYPGLPDSIVDHAFEWVAPAIRKAVAPAAKPGDPDPAWQQYVGLYRDPWYDRQVLILDGQLAMIEPTEADVGRSLGTLVPVGAHTFRLEGGRPGGPHGELVVFELDGEGKVTRMKIGENFSDRLRSIGMAEPGLATFASPDHARSARVPPSTAKLGEMSSGP